MSGRLEPETVSSGAYKEHPPSTRFALPTPHPQDGLSSLLEARSGSRRKLAMVKGHLIITEFRPMR